MSIPVLVLVAVLGGCASQERWMSLEEDQAMKAECQEKGCVIVPNPIWHGIIRLLRSAGIEGI